MESRQNDKRNEGTTTETSHLTVESTTAPQQTLSTTANIQCILSDEIQRSIIIEEKQDEIIDDFLIIKNDTQEKNPPAVIYEDQLIHIQQVSDDKKIELGVKSSCHTVNIVSYDENGCDIVFSPAFPNDLDLNQLPGNSNACYIFTADKKLYYADKLLRIRTPITLSPEDFDTLFSYTIAINKNFEIYKLLKLGMHCEDSIFYHSKLPSDILGIINKFQISKTSLKYNYPVTDKNIALKPNIKTQPILPSTCSKFNDLQNCKEFQIILPKANKVLLQFITLKTKHIHGMCFYKHKPPGTVMSALEAINSTAYQLLGPRNFPSCFVVRDLNNKDIGIISKALPGFKPNRDRPLLVEDLEINSLKQMIKKRSEYELNQLEELCLILKDLIPLLKREVNPNYSYIYQVWEFAKFTGHYYLGDTYSAVHVKPQLEKFILKNKPYITFGDLESLFSLFINRKANIEKVENSYIATQHRHAEEIALIEKAIDKLSLILLNEVALFIREIHRKSRELQKNWKDLHAEKSALNGSNIIHKIEKGIFGHLDVSIDDIINYRVNCGLAIGLMSRLDMEDPDGHSKNLAYDGKNIDGDEAANKLTYRFKNPRRKPGPNDFAFEKDSIIHFPNKITKLRYWPTVATIFDTSADAALSPISDLTKNYFTTQDNQNYQSLEFSSVFNFQKYVQIILFSLKDQNMFAASAALHMNDQFNMLNEDGDINAPLPLKDENGRKQDVMTTWVEHLTKRASESLALAKQLIPVKFILEHHSELVLEIIQDSFADFLHDKKMEFKCKPDAYAILEQTMKPEIIQDLFYIARHEILFASENKNLLSL